MILWINNILWLYRKLRWDTPWSSINIVTWIRAGSNSIVKHREWMEHKNMFWGVQRTTLLKIQEKISCVYGDINNEMHGIIIFSETCPSLVFPSFSWQYTILQKGEISLPCSSVGSLHHNRLNWGYNQIPQGRKSLQGIIFALENPSFLCFFMISGM